MEEEKVAIAVSDGSGEMSGFVVDPQPGAERPGVLLIQEVFGVNDYIRSVARQLAAQGYRVCAPDLFWRIEPEIELDPGTEEGRERSKQLRQAFEPAKGLEDCKSTAAFLRRGSPKVGVVGFCMGGRQAFHLALGPHVDASVAYYGTGIHKLLDHSKHLTVPLLLHIAEKDHLCDDEARFLIYEVLGPSPDVELHTYSGAGHAFARPGGKSYNEEAASLAHRRTAEFLRRHLST